MAASSGDTFRIVLGKSTPSKHETVSAEFSHFFGVNDSLAQQIVKSAPIVILADLSRNQAMEIVQVLAPLRKSGGDLRIEISDDRSISQVAWPSEPKIDGKGLSEYERDTSAAGIGIFCCPECGARLRVSSVKTTNQDDLLVNLPSDTRERQPIGLDDDQRIGVSPEEETGMHKAEDDTDSHLNDDIFDEPEDTEESLFEDIKPLTDTSGYGAVTGNIEKFETDFKPVVPPQPKPTPSKSPISGSGSGMVQKPRSKRILTGASSTPASSPQPELEEGPFSVVIPKTTNQRVVPLMMKHMGISETEARENMKKPLIPVIKNLSRPAANRIADEYRRIGLNPRIGRKR